MKRYNKVELLLKAFRFWSAIYKIYGLLIVGGILTSALYYFEGAPILIQVLVVCAILTLLFGLAVATNSYLSGNVSGLHTPRYLKWYKFPLFRDVTWNFENYIGGSCGGNVAVKDVKVGSLQMRVKVHKKMGIHPKKAAIKSLSTGAEYNLTFETKDGHHCLDRISIIQNGACALMVLPISTEGHTVDGREFLDNFNGFVLEFEYDNKKFKRIFPPYEIIQVLTSMASYSSSPQVPQIIPYPLSERSSASQP